MSLVRTWHTEQKSSRFKSEILFLCGAYLLLFFPKYIRDYSSLNQGKFQLKLVLTSSAMIR